MQATTPSGTRWTEVAPPGGYGASAYRTIVAQATVPALVHGDFVLAESSVPPPTFDHLASLDWIDAAENIVLVGPAGTGKSHILLGIGEAAVVRDHGGCAAAGEVPGRTDGLQPPPVPGGSALVQGEGASWGVRGTRIAFGDFPPTGRHDSGGQAPPPGLGDSTGGSEEAAPAGGSHWSTGWGEQSGRSISTVKKI